MLIEPGIPQTVNQLMDRNQMVALKKFLYPINILGKNTINNLIFSKKKNPNIYWAYALKK
jgi:hypothetical protein